MYRTLLKTSLNTTDLMHTNKLAPEGIKYCNFLCQDYRDKNEFSGIHTSCNNCRNIQNLAEKQISEKKITLEQFKENPEIINGIDVVFESKKTCLICKEEKNINQFESSRSECKACKAIKTKTRNNKDIEVAIADILKAKDNLISLENYVKTISKDKLIIIISHFQVGRKSSDTKDRMVFNVVEHFRKMMTPTLCQGGCGYTLQEEFSTCKACEIKNKKPTAICKMATFEDNIDEIAENLEEITPQNDYLYNREQYAKISQKLGLKVKQKDKRDDVIKMINEKVKTRKEEKAKLLFIEDPKNIEVCDKIELNGFLILAREDGFINATELCKAGGKEFKHWNSLESTKLLIQTLEQDEILKVGIPTFKNTDPVFKSVDSQKGRYGCSWIHPDLAVQLAQWISPTFSLKVSRWVREIAITGTVKAGKELSNKQLLEFQNKISQDKEKFKTLENNHKNILKKRQYHKFEKGPAFYVVSAKDNNYKIGFDDIDINQRLRSYRTLVPDFKLHYLVYTSDAFLLEQNILRRFDYSKLEANHEVVINVKLNEIVESVNMLISFCNFKATTVSQEEIDKYSSEE